MPSRVNVRSCTAPSLALECITGEPEVRRRKAWKKLTQLLAAALKDGHGELPARNLPVFGKISAKCCSFSAVSAPIFARKYAFCRIFQNFANFATFAIFLLNFHKKC